MGCGGGAAEELRLPLRPTQAISFTLVPCSHCLSACHTPALVCQPPRPTLLLLPGNATDVTKFKTRSAWGEDPMKGVETQVKSAFTRAFNQQHIKPKTGFGMDDKVSKKRGGGAKGKAAAAADDDDEEDVFGG